MLKNLLAILLAIAVVSATTIRAADDDKMKAFEARLSALEKENAQLKARQAEIKSNSAATRAVEQTTSKYGHTAYLSYDRPDVKGFGLNFTGDFLYWKVQQSDQDYAAVGVPGTTSNGLVGNGHIRSLELDWSPGFRLGIGFRLPYDGWDANINYTRLTSSTSDTVASVNGRQVFGLAFANDADADTDLAHGELNFKYDAINLEMGRKSKISDTFSLRAFGGPSIVRIQNDLSLFYQGNNFSASGARLRDQNTFMGYGMRGGLEGDLKFSHGFSINGMASGSLLTGKFDLKHLETDGTAININYKEETFRVVPALQVAAGVAWDHQFGDYLHLKATLGYEINNYFNMIQRRRFPDQGDVNEGLTFKGEGNLGMHGLFFRIKLDF